MLHVLRRNVDVTILLFNNRIYGLTKGQYSPTSELGKVTKSTPLGSADRPVNPLAFALGCGATFVAPHGRPQHPAHGRDAEAGGGAPGDARSWRSSRTATSTTTWPGTCSTTRSRRCMYELRLAARQAAAVRAARRPQGRHHGRRDAEGGRSRQGVPESALWVHDEKNLNAAKLLADLFAPDFPVPIGVLVDVEAPIYEDVIARAGAARAGRARPRRHRQAADLRRHLADFRGGGLAFLEGGFAPLPSSAGLTARSAASPKSPNGGGKAAARSGRPHGHCPSLRGPCCCQSHEVFRSSRSPGVHLRREGVNCWLRWD